MSVSVYTIGKTFYLVWPQGYFCFFANWNEPGEDTLWTPLSLVLSMVMLINLIVAVSKNGGIGINGRLPWSLKYVFRVFVRRAHTACIFESLDLIPSYSFWFCFPLLFHIKLLKSGFLQICEYGKYGCTPYIMGCTGMTRHLRSGWSITMFFYDTKWFTA